MNLLQNISECLRGFGEANERYRIHYTSFLLLVSFFVVFAFYPHVSLPFSLLYYVLVPSSCSISSSEERAVSRFPSLYLS